MEVVCWSCHKSLEAGDSISRTQECPHCTVDLHACRMCKFFDDTVSGGCKETQADYVHRKDKANFCEYFKPGTHGPADTSKADEARARLEALFKK
ncbi:MAG: hypothetical protein R3E66_18435 [bacterium]